MIQNNTKKKVAFFDLDGTLVSHKMNAVPESTRKAIKALQKQGILVILATGRHEVELAKLPSRDIPFDGYMTLNGQMCRDRNKNLFFESPLDQQDVDILYRLFKNREIPMIFKEKDRVYINFINELVEQAQRDINTPLPEIGEYHGEDIYQIVVFVKQNQEDSVSRILTHSVATRWNKNAVDIVPADGGKGKGILEYLKGIGYSREDAMAFGDGPNDLEMLETVSLGICMGNGDDTVKEIADYVTDSVDEDGIWNAMKNLGYL